MSVANDFFDVTDLESGSENLNFVYEGSEDVFQGLHIEAKYDDDHFDVELTYLFFTVTAIVDDIDFTINIFNEEGVTSQPFHVVSELR